MLSEINAVKEFLRKEYGGLDKVKPGTYAIPYATSKGVAYMKVIVHEDMGLSGFYLYKDKEFKETFFNTEK